ncbi:MAG: hypothetical protein ABT940_13175, partial [Alphaproteobacteria bacterium]
MRLSHPLLQRFIAGTVTVAGRVRSLTGGRRYGVAAFLGLLLALTLPPVGAFPLLLVTMPVFVWLID